MNNNANNPLNNNSPKSPNANNVNNIVLNIFISITSFTFIKEAV